MVTKRAATAAVFFGYKTAALSTGRLPTITQLCARRRWLAAGVVTALVVHLLQEQSSLVQAAGAAGPRLEQAEQE